MTVTPSGYRRWRHSRLGSITESRELEVIFDLIGDVEGHQLLDVGAGDGTYSIEAARRGAVVTAVDVSPAMCLAAEQRAASHEVTLRSVAGDAQNLPFDDDTFDIVLAVTTLCLVPDRRKAIEEMARVLAPGGRLILGELGRWSTWAAWRRIRGWWGNETWRSAHFHSRRQLATLVGDAGLTLQQVRGAVYYPPFPILARMLGPLDRHLGRVTSLGAAFIAVAAAKPKPDNDQPGR